MPFYSTNCFPSSCLEAHDYKCKYAIMHNNIFLRFISSTELGSLCPFKSLIIQESSRDYFTCASKYHLLLTTGHFLLPVTTHSHVKATLMFPTWVKNGQSARVELRRAQEVVSPTFLSLRRRKYFSLPLILHSRHKTALEKYSENSQESWSVQRRRWHPTLVLLPGESHGWGSLLGCSPWGR